MCCSKSLKTGVQTYLWHKMPGAGQATMWYTPLITPQRWKQEGQKFKVISPREFKANTNGRLTPLPLIPTSTGQFKTSMVYRASFRTARTMKRNLLRKNKTKQEKKKHSFQVQTFSRRESIMGDTMFQEFFN